MVVFAYDIHWLRISGWSKSKTKFWEIQHFCQIHLQHIKKNMIYPHQKKDQML